MLKIPKNQPLVLYLQPRLAHCSPYSPDQSNKASLHVFVFVNLTMDYRCKAVKAFTECKPNRSPCVSLCSNPTRPMHHTPPQSASDVEQRFIHAPPPLHPTRLPRLPQPAALPHGPTRGLLHGPVPRPPGGLRGPQPGSPAAGLQCGLPAAPGTPPGPARHVPAGPHGSRPGPHGSRPAPGTQPPIH